MPEEGTTGLFGKLPAHGDFVRRGLPRSFIGPWDDWLSAGIEASRHDLGPAWDEAWESAPAWRFRLAPGACGPDAAVGVVVTSADTVGRRFPLTLAAVLPSAAIPPPESWFDALEAAAWQGRAGEVDADGLLALLPAPPPDDPDATLDGRSLFWTAGVPAIRMPLALDFASLLGPTDAAPQTAISGLPFVAAAPVLPDAEPALSEDLDMRADTPPDDAWGRPALPFASDLPFAPAGAEPAADASGELLWLDPSDGPGESPSLAVAHGDDPITDTPEEAHIWPETVELPWAVPAAPSGADHPHDPEAGAAA
jgi:type VI secretion system protein ImpM